MDINMLNTYTTEIYLNGNEESFNKLLVDIDNIINHSAHIIHEEVKDKILYSTEDLKQEILIKIWLEVIGKLVKFNCVQDVKDFVFKKSKEVLEETR